MVDRARTAFAHALGLLSDGSPTAAKARVLAGAAGMHAIQGEYEQAIRVGHEALAAAEGLGLDEVRAAALSTVGTARLGLGDKGGIGDLEESRRVAVHIRAIREAGRACNNLAVVFYESGELPRAFALLEEASLLAEQAGDADLVRFGRAMMLLPAIDGGRWDDCVRLADAFIDECEAGAPHTQQSAVHCHRGSIRLAREEDKGAVDDAERALELVREVQQPDRVFYALGFAVRVFAESGTIQRARELAADFLAEAGLREPPPWSYIHFAWAAAEVGCVEELDRWLEAQKRQTTWIVVTRAVVRGEYAEAAELFAEMEARPHEAYARLRAGEKLVAEGRRAEADEQLEQALDFFRSVGATRYIREAEALQPAAAERRA